MINQMNVSKITIASDFNARHKGSELTAHINQLANNMTENGYDPARPLTVTPEGQLVDGHCRYQAVLKANKKGAAIDDVPVVVKTYSDAATMVSELLNANSGRNLSMLEKGEVALRLVAEGWTRKDIATRTMLTAAAVGQSVKVAECSDEIKAHIISGAVSASKVYDMLCDAERKLKDKGYKAEAEKVHAMVFKAIEKLLAGDKTPDESDVTDNLPEYDHNHTHNSEAGVVSTDKTTETKAAKVWAMLHDYAEEVNEYDDEDAGEPMITLSFTKENFETVRSFLFGE